jgi:hypothetical protein
MNKNIENQIYRELEKTCLALDWKSTGGRANQYNDMCVCDVKVLNKMYHHLLNGEVDKSVKICVGLDTDVYEQVPVKILNYIDGLN